MKNILGVPEYSEKVYFGYVWIEQLVRLARQLVLFGEASLVPIP